MRQDMQNAHQDELGNKFYNARIRLKNAQYMAKATLQELDNLGFASFEEAARAVLNHEDFLSRWNIKDTDHVLDLLDWKDQILSAKSKGLI